MKFHFNPHTGQANQCSATVRPCAFGGANEHGNTREAAVRKYEESQRGGVTGQPLSKKAAKASLQAKIKGTPNPEAALAAQERARSNAAGTHDNRPKRQRSRKASKAAAIADHN